MPRLRSVFARFTLPLIIFALLAGALEAQEPAASGGGETSEVNTENVEGLIETLESETARQELIAELRALLEVNEEAEEPAPELASAVKIDEAAQVVKEKYTDFLESHGLNASLVGYLVVTTALLIITAVVFYLLRRLLSAAHHRLNPLIVRYHLSRQRIGIYFSVLRLCAYLAITLIAVAAILALWGLELDIWVSQDIQLLIVQAVVSVAAVFAVGAFIIEFCNATVEHLFRRRLSHNQARMNTLLPIARNVLLLTLFTFFGLTLLSQLGLNVMPLLAGAGVVGFAVGFGAQALIKDVLNGFIIIIEDLIQVGDVAILSGKAGLVEKITIRKVQLRDLNGAVYTVPFSEVSIVENLTKDFSYYLMDIGVAYREDTDRVVALLREIDEGMRKDENFRDMILEPIEILGVDRFADSAVIIKARIKTPPIQQWAVGREFNRRMKQVFDAHNVEIPFPHRTLYFGENTDGTAPPARVQLQGQPSANDGEGKDTPAL